MQFINRKQELEFLEKKYNSPDSELLIFYGRRRIGKTQLLVEFSKDKKSLYFMCRLESREDTFRRFNALFIEQFQDVSLLNHPLQNFDAIFDYLSDKSKEKIMIIIDEFPFLVEKFPEIISILQDKWDSKLKSTKIKLILLGSSVAMMEKYALEYKSPLYGRRTGQWKVDKFSIAHMKQFFPNYDIKSLIYLYSAIDSIPGYLGLFDKDKSILENIDDKILSKGEFLYEEVEILLQEELRDPSNYMSIISVIAGGVNSFNEIFNKTRLDKTMLSKYIKVLESLGIVERILPITETYKNKLKSKNSLYIIKDNFYDFWLKFVYLNKNEIERGHKGILRRQERQFESYVSYKFENFCREFLEIEYPDYNHYGRWWHKGKEIDIVGLNEDKKEILFAECKWQEKVNSFDVLKDLAEKSRFVEWNLNNRKECFVIFAKSFSKRIAEFSGQKVYCFDLRDIELALK